MNASLEDTKHSPFCPCFKLSHCNCELSVQQRRISTGEPKTDVSMDARLKEMSIRLTDVQRQAQEQVPYN